MTPRPEPRNNDWEEHEEASMKTSIEPEAGTLFHDSYRSPIGVLNLLVDKKGRAVSILFEGEDLNLKNTGLKNGREQCRQLKAWLTEYFASGTPPRNVKLVLTGTDFQKKVWNTILHVQFGQTSSYMNIAQAIGKPYAYRAVGNAVGANPLPILIPCHRIIRANGKPGNYRGGLKKKLYLLDHEKHSLL